eukprot:3890553-Prorocentrum_lima.AAC.1
MACFVTSRQSAAHCDLWLMPGLRLLSGVGAFCFPEGTAKIQLFIPLGFTVWMASQCAGPPTIQCCWVTTI